MRLSFMMSLAALSCLATLTACGGDTCDVDILDDSSWPAEWADREAAMLAEVNVRRMAGAVCGGDEMPPVPVLASSASLRRAARHLSDSMAKRRFFSHDDRDGCDIFGRITAAGWTPPERGGYAWGENIDRTRESAAESVQAFMDSPGHCRNIMDPDFAFVGMGYVADPDSEFRHYYTQDFASHP